MERLAELKYDITKLDAKIENMQERINKMAFDDKTEVGIKFLASTVSYLKELKEYKNLEEQGLLLRLPCKVGTDVWTIMCGMTGKHPILLKQYFELSMLKYWGKSVFLTKSEAEQKLKEMECD